MSANPSSSPHLPRYNDTDIQPFFILHKHRDSGTKPPLRDSRRFAAKSSSGGIGGEDSEEHVEDGFLGLRMEAFDVLWAQIESAIKDALKNINCSVYKLVHRWVNESFQATKSWRPSSCMYPAQSYPIISDVSYRRLYTGLIFTKNLDFVDDVLTFEELGLLLKSEGCLVAHLSSIDISAKSEIGGCLKGLLRQFTNVTLDVADISSLASWYYEQQTHDNPLVVIVEDMEKCCGSVLSELILMLSEWAIKLPVTLVLGVATTPEAPQNLLSSDAQHRLNTFKFMLGSPSERMDAIVEAVLLMPSYGFTIGCKVALFLRKYFLQLDGTLASFTRALKVACTLHFSKEPLSFLLQDFMREDDREQPRCKNPAFPLDEALKYASRLPSCQRMTDLAGANLTRGLAELKRSQNCWVNGIRRRYGAGESKKVQLLDLYYEALTPESSESRISNSHARSKRGRDTSPPGSECMPGQHASVPSLDSISPSVSKLRDYTLYMESLPFHEVICFKDVNKLQSALLGIPRRKIPADLAESEQFIRCSCCCGRGDNLFPSLQDTSIMYLLAKEHGDIINLHDWYQAFKSTVTRPATKGKGRSKHSSPKKRKRADYSGNTSEAAIQARFCRAVMELQLLGFVRMPSRRRPDYVQSIIFGLKPL
ncbi:hypothetical protein Droror1_Dr00009343 [Drosera rotundifolia]